MSVYSKNRINNRNVIAESDSESDSDSDDDGEFVQLHDGDADADHSMEFFTAAENGMTPNGKEYTRQLPSQFDEDSPNNFMRHMIMEYALE